MLKMRVLSAIIGIPIIIFFILLRGPYLFAFTLILALVGFREYKKSFESANIKVFEFSGYVVTALYFITLRYNCEVKYFGVIISFYILFMLAYEIIMQRDNITSVALSLFGFFYISFLFSHLLLIDRVPRAEVILWLPFLTAWFTDTCAYFTGINFGTYKPFPKISPNKTVEGVIGGIVGCMLLTMISGIVVNALGYNFSLFHFAIIGLLCGAASVLGDLSASYIKRFCGVKDYGNLIPGHGGILDRFDSILFTAPTIYFYFADVLKIFN